MNARAAMPFCGYWRRLNSATRSAPNSTDGACLRRDDYLIADSSLLVCYYDGKQPGGTLYPVMHASRKKRGILNLCANDKGDRNTHRVGRELVE